MLVTANHPVVADRVAQLRDPATGGADFRRLVREISEYLTYEATRDLSVEVATIRTSLGLNATCSRVTAPGPVVVPILCEVLGMLDGVLEALPNAEVGVIGLRRDESTHRPVVYCEKLRDDLTGREAFVIDPRLATGGSLVTACEMLLARGVAKITALAMIAAPEGVAFVENHIPDLNITQRLWMTA